MVKNITIKKFFSVLIMMALAITVFAGCTGSSQHKYVITYEAPAKSITAEQMNDAISIITERYKAIDYSNVTVTPDGDNKLKVEVSGDELTKAQAEIIGKRNEIKILGPDKSVIITSADIIDSVSQQDPKTMQNMVLIKFTPDGKNKLAVATAKYTGQQITIYLDDEVISAPVVGAIINDGQALIASNLGDSEAKVLATILKDKNPLPCVFEVTNMSQE